MAKSGNWWYTFGNVRSLAALGMTLGQALGMTLGQALGMIFNRDGEVMAKRHLIER